MAARFVRDEEAAGSNPATPTGKRQVTEHIVTCCLCYAFPVSDFGSPLGANTDMAGSASASGLSSNGTTASGGQRYAQGCPSEMGRGLNENHLLTGLRPSPTSGASDWLM